MKFRELITFCVRHRLCRNLLASIGTQIYDYISGTYFKTTTTHRKYIQHESDYASTRA